MDHTPGVGKMDDEDAKDDAMGVMVSSILV
jgi:hypothetical protein